MHMCVVVLYSTSKIHNYDVSSIWKGTVVRLLITFRLENIVGFVYNTRCAIGEFQGLSDPTDTQIPACHIKINKN